MLLAVFILACFVVVLLVLAVLLVRYCAMVERGAGGWTSPFSSDSFDVDTIEVALGRFYVEVAWGWWRK